MGKSMHPDVENAFHNLDNAIFNDGTFFNDEDMASLETYLKRWKKGVSGIKKAKADLEREKMEATA